MFANALAARQVAAIAASAEGHTQQVNFTSTCLLVALSPGCLAFKLDEAASQPYLNPGVHSACGSGLLFDCLACAAKTPWVPLSALLSCRTHKASSVCCSRVVSNSAV
jgi:hypothetical protein